MFCINCGIDLPTNARFCHSCGTGNNIAAVAQSRAAFHEGKIMEAIGIIMMLVGYFVPVASFGFFKYSIFDLLLEQANDPVWVPAALLFFIILALIKVFAKPTLEVFPRSKVLYMAVAKPALGLIPGIGYLVIFGLQVLSDLSNVSLERYMEMMNIGFYLSIIGCITLIYGGHMTRKREQTNHPEKQKATHRFFKCPCCSKSLRVPSGIGRLRIMCPKCGENFFEKT